MRTPRSSQHGGVVPIDLLRCNTTLTVLSDIHAQQQPKPFVFAIVLKLSPEFTAQLAIPGVVEAVAEAAQAGRTPSVGDLVRLGQKEEFARVFIERLNYLLRLQQAGILLTAGPFGDLKEGMYLCNAKDEHDAQRILEEDPLYLAGFIEREFTVRRWLVA